MKTDVEIDRLIQKAQKLGRHRTKTETVSVALDEYVQCLKRLRMSSSRASPRGRAKQKG
jgi:hypothetical protein